VKPYKNLQLLNSMGAMVWHKDMEGQCDSIPVSLKQVSPGVYLLRVVGNDYVHKEKIIIQ
jgi:hypothetical protein